jgi:probable F420-dependent oxidoreductase
MLPPQLDLGQVVPSARRAEELGYDFLACGEHVFFHVPTPNAFVALAAAAGATERIGLLSATTVLPVYPPALAAKMATTLDRISGGRFELGVGVGGEYPAELAACGIPLAERGARTDEALALLARLFSGETVTHEGRFFHVDGQRLDPPPVRPSGPPVWIGGRRAAATRRTGRFGDVWMPYMISPEQLSDGMQDVRAAAVEHGRPADRIRGALYCWAAVDTDGERARRTALDVLGRIYQQDFAPLADRYVPTGTPDRVAARLREYADAGAETVIFSPACPDAELERMAALFAEEVAPALRQRGQAHST